ncbi:hypothetical protein UFOVP27_30 [uncultured Caudovirales phage]|uniref:Uncharacterized protein n=1 Tax=uncultured Caudovirales phage TaxID=2100421 RepID=A0A6J5KLF7_9CAUD|nr:hypothetical protein UFOVP27_30 [uncultured Caudovirales phage]
MNLVFMGAEVPSHRILLTNMGVKHVSINFYRLAKRGLPKTKDYVIQGRFPDDVKVYVDGGGHQINDLKLTERELQEYADTYLDFLAVNADRISGATELDVKSMGQAWNTYHRTQAQEILGDKLWVVWHQETGHTALYALCERFTNVALLGESLEDDTTLSARSKAMLSQFPELQFHGIACAKPDNLRQVALSTASSLSWLSPMMRGETIVWNGTKLVRYQKKQKDQARPRYKAIIEKAGLDYDKIINDDSNEVTRLAIWSYLQLEKALDKRSGKKLSDNSEFKDDPGSAETGGADPDNNPILSRKVLSERGPDERHILPVFGVKNKTVVEKDDNGKDTIRDVPVLSSTSASLRQCDTCFVAANCPAFKPSNACAFSLPVEIKTKDQLRSLLNAVVEMQGARVAFARFSEELNGGYPDPNTGQEIDRLFKLVGQMKELEENKEFIRITAERQSSGGVLSALFGDKANTLRELPNGGVSEAQSSRILDEGF